MKNFIFVTLFLTGCGSAQRSCTALTGDLQKKCSNGVEYVQSDSGLAVSYTFDKTSDNLKPVHCN